MLHPSGGFVVLLLTLALVAFVLYIAMGIMYGIWLYIRDFITYIWKLVLRIDRKLGNLI